MQRLHPRVRSPIVRGGAASSILAVIAFASPGCAAVDRPTVAQADPETCDYVPSTDGACPDGLVRCYFQGAVLCIAPEQEDACCETIARTSAR